MFKSFVIMRATSTEVDYIVNVDEVETLEGIEWKDAVKYAKANYTVKRTDKRRSTIWVA